MAQPANATPRRPRRFLPEPIETSSRSSKKHEDDRPGKSHMHPRQAGSRIFELDANSSTLRPGKPDCTSQPGQIDQHTECTKSSGVNDFTASDLIHATSPSPKVGGKQQRNPRKFAPQLMETARHSFRPEKNANESGAPGGFQASSSSNATPASSPLAAGPHVIQESPFSYSSLLRRQETRRHSFRVPDLPAIPSSGSEESDEPGSPHPPKQPIISQHSHLLEYIVPFPTHPSESQLKEQALAAFPNEQVYQPVDHFAIDRDEEESPYEEELRKFGSRLGSRVNRRASSADLPSELEYLRRHKEEAGMNRRHYLTTRGGRLSLASHRISKRSLDKAANRDQRWELDRPLTQSQAISPPMLGGDLIFPQSVTPETTICEGYHTIGVADGPPISSPFSGLWSVSPCSSLQYESGGLWNGTCKLDRHSTHGNGSLMPGLVTPRHGFEAVAYDSESEDPPHQNPATHVLREGFNHSDCTDQEFNDKFVTQIYDYLSLGYPSVARYYDYELSKVSGISVAALRADDLKTDAKGHVGVHEITAKSAVDGVCTRWTALRLYIKEWARQHPRMFETDPYHETWGVRERKGSWAV